MPLEPLVLPHGPPTQGEVEVLEDWIERGLVVAAEVPNPATDDGIEHVRQVRQGLVGAPWETPRPTHLLADPLRRRPAHRRTEAHEVGSASVSRPSWAKREAQELETRLRIARASIRILAVHDLGLARMYLQLASREPLLHRLPNPFGLVLRQNPVRWPRRLTFAPDPARISLHDHHAAPPAPTLPVPLRRPPAVGSGEPCLAPPARRLQASAHATQAAQDGSSLWGRANQG